MKMYRFNFPVVSNVHIWGQIWGHQLNLFQLFVGFCKKEFPLETNIILHNISGTECLYEEICQQCCLSSHNPSQRLTRWPWKIWMKSYAQEIAKRSLALTDNKSPLAKEMWLVQPDMVFYINTWLQWKYQNFCFLLSSTTGHLVNKVGNLCMQWKGFP